MTAIETIAAIMGIGCVLGGFGAISPSTAKGIYANLEKKSDAFWTWMGLVAFVLAIAVFYYVLGAITQLELVAALTGGYLLMVGIYCTAPGVVRALVKVYRGVSDTYFRVACSIEAIVGIVILYLVFV
ncbi:MAG: hypothetical protein ACE5PM_08890 [Candidatus Hydrothermarchaeales archaeon]